MSISKIIDKIDLIPNKEEILNIKKKTDELTDLLKDYIKKEKIDADVFVGGSFAKGTLVRKEEYEVDIFIRFDWEYENLSDHLKKIMNNFKGASEKIHGSRDYFRIKKENILFEIIPVLRIKKTIEARNVTDLSYFHINYVRKKINTKIAGDIAIAKAFCKAQGVYGAESYIRGFSGYALECLIIHYKSFEKTLKELVKVKGRLILDPEKMYENKDEIVINLNENKLNSPVILIDPTFKERNVLAALSRETFNKFQSATIEFLKRPSASFFEEKEIDSAEMRKDAIKKKYEFLCIGLKTNKQAGDIAGTKMKKFSNFISLEIERYFEILQKEFVYHGAEKADFYIILKSKKEVVKIGPPINMKKACSAFKKSNKNVFVKSGFLHSTIRINYSAKRFVEQWAKKYAKKVKEMDITEMEID